MVCWYIGELIVLLFWQLLSNNSDKQRLLPQTLSSSVGRWYSLVVSQYCIGRRSKYSKRVYFLFYIVPKVCFSNLACAIGKVLSFLCLGGFHWQGRYATGMSSLRSSTKVEVVPDVRGLSWNWGNVSKTNACSNADTWVQLADFLKVKF